MKYRLVIDNDAATQKPWYVVQEWDPKFSMWSRVDSGYEEECRKIYNRLISGKDKFTVVEQSEDEVRYMFKAREAKADLGL